MRSGITFYDAFRFALRRAADYNRADQVRPATVLWPDRERQWEPLLPRLRAELPILTLGPYDPATQTGPAIWLRCMIAGTLPDADWLEDVVSILYLPGVGRQELRAVEDCPRLLQPLAELQYRGNLFTQKNGRDWTIEAFLRTADGGLQIEVMGDTTTREALTRALLKLADEPVEALRAEAPLTAVKLNALLNPDSALAILRWMNDPAGQRATRNESEWEAFRAICRQQFGFDPATDGEVTAAGLLGQQEGIWSAVWRRFTEAPQRYPYIPERLRRARPANPDGLFHNPSSWPQDNEDAEAELRERLSMVRDSLPNEARQQIHQAEAQHAQRREWVWADLGLAPLACVLPALVRLVEITSSPLGGSTPQEIACAYAADAWRADAAVLEALRVDGTPEDKAAVRNVVEAVYRPWLEGAAEAFQRAVSVNPIPRPIPTSPNSAPPGCCWLFVDGLRFDVGQELADSLERNGAVVVREWTFAAMPCVTPTCKPSVSPVASAFGPGSEFSARVLSDSAKVTADILRRELVKTGFETLVGDDTGMPSGRAWTEAGNFDAHGHAEGWKLALRIPEEIREITARIKALLNAGWSEVRVVTDHGWLLMPGGLPKADLPEHLTETRKGRCARLKPSAITDQQIVPWYWDSDVRIAVAPAIRCYVAGREYEHGGLSPQECVGPLLRVRLAVSAKPATIVGVKWTGLRCRVQVANAPPGFTLDIRTRAAESSTSVAASVKTPDASGQASLVVPDDSRQGEAALIVLIDDEGKPLAQQPTVIGEQD